MFSKVKSIIKYIKENPKIYFTESTTMIGMGAIGLSAYESYTGLFTVNQATGIALFGVGLLFPESDSKQERMQQIVSSAILALSYMHGSDNTTANADSKKK